MVAPIETFEIEAGRYRRQRQDFWNAVYAGRRSPLGAYYRRRIQQAYGNLIPAGATVLEIGCAEGHLLAAMAPGQGVGVDFSDTAITQARKTYPELEFIVADAHDFDLGQRTFDYIIVSELLNDIWDVQTFLTWIKRYCAPHTRLIFNVQSHLWSLPLRAARKLGLAARLLVQNWLTPHDIENLLEISGYQPLRKWGEVLLPVYIPLLSSFANRYLVRISPFRFLAFSSVLMARPDLPPKVENPTASVVVAARNESGHIDELMARIPEMGSGTEIVFVEGNSTDGTFEAIARAIEAHPERNCKLLKQPGKGKGDAVRCGFDAASGDILMILDADITVPPEDLPRFHSLLAGGAAEFVNGVRLVYPMNDQAMRFANLIGNRFFSWAFSWLLGQQIRDTLCGTKVLWRADYQRIAANRSHFGDFDPFGDFDLLFGAAHLNLKIMEVPIRYRARRYGETNISRWRHGVLLLRMVMFAARRIKFV